MSMFDYANSYFLMDRTYLRLKNLVLSYDLPLNIIRTLKSHPVLLLSHGESYPLLPESDKSCRSISTYNRNSSVYCES